MTSTIAIEFTLEEAMEARFCVNRYSALYPMPPNEHFHPVRESIVKKIDAAYIQYADEHEAEMEQFQGEEEQK